MLAGHVDVGFSGSHSEFNCVPGPRVGHPDPITPGWVRASHREIGYPVPAPGCQQQSLFAGQSLGPSQLPLVSPIPSTTQPEVPGALDEGPKA